MRSIISSYVVALMSLGTPVLGISPQMYDTQKVMTPALGKSQSAARWHAPIQRDSPFDYRYTRQGPIYDIRKFATPVPNTLYDNRVVLHWITTTEGLDFFVTTFTAFGPDGDDPHGRNQWCTAVADVQTGGFSSYHRQGVPIDYSQSKVDIHYKDQFHWYSPSADNVSTTTWTSHSDDFKFDMTFELAGPNIYYGGTGVYWWGTGYTHQWGAPGALTSGTFTINNTEHTVDPERSVSWMDRQWGTGVSTTGWYWFPIFLSDGTRLGAWVLPAKGEYNFAHATILRDDGTERIVDILPEIEKYDPVVSEKSNITYHKTIILTLPEVNGRLNITAPQLKGEGGYGECYTDDKKLIFFDAWAEVSGIWEGKYVTGWSVSEQKIFFG